MPVVTSNVSNESGHHRSEEGRHHRETTAAVRLKAQRLRRALDSDRLDDAIKIAADMAGELRSPSASELSPKGYYDVYLSVCAELRLLEMYVMESARRGAPVLELYERVQETQLVLPRLYLLITAGSVYAKSLQAPAKDVLRDLVEMCAGVQHPQRGLFLRAYLAQMMKDKLPDTIADDMNSQRRLERQRQKQEKSDKQKISVASKKDDADESNDGDDDDDSINSGGTVLDSIEFVVRNFTEMNRLWVRMQHDGSPREMEIREKERLELRLLVGSNIATLSRLVGDNLSLYRESVLPAVLEQIVTCKDAIAQEYLADCVAQVFPDDFQLATLEAFMGMCASLVRGVNMRTILVSIIDRLTRYAASGTPGAEAARAANAFHVFRTELPDVLKPQGNSLALSDRLVIYQSLMSFALQAEPDRADYVDDVLGFCVQDMNDAMYDNNQSGSSHHPTSPSNPTTPGTISIVDAMVNRTVPGTSLPAGMRGNVGMNQRRIGKKVALSPEDERLAMKVLTMPLEAFNSVGAILKLENYVVLQCFLTYENQKSLAARLLMSANEYEPCIRDVTTLEKLFRFVSPLVLDEQTLDSRGLDDDGEDEFSDDGMDNFDVGSLTHHHEYLIGLFPVSHSASVIRSNNASPTGRVAGPGGARRREIVNSPATAAKMGHNADVVGPSGFNDIDEDFERNQELVARIVFLCESSDIENTCGLYIALRQELLHGGEKRLYFSLPSLVFASLRLALRCGGSGDDGRIQMERMLTFAAECIDFLGEASSLLALRLRLHVAETAASLAKGGESEVDDTIDGNVKDTTYGKNETESDQELSNTSSSSTTFQISNVVSSTSATSITSHGTSKRGIINSNSRFVYDNMAEAFVAYEQQVTTSREQNLALELIVAQLGHVRDVLDRGAYEALSTRAVKHATRALTRSDQCVLLCRCALLFNSDLGQRALNCIQKALTAADYCVSAAERVLLLLDIASVAVRVHEDSVCDVCHDGLLASVMYKIRHCLGARRAKTSALGKVALARYQRIIAYIKVRLEHFDSLDVTEL